MPEPHKSHPSALGLYSPHASKAMSRRQMIPDRLLGVNCHHGSSPGNSADRHTPASSFFSFGFSSSSCFRRLASDTLMPPSLSRHRGFFLAQHADNLFFRELASLHPSVSPQGHGRRKQRLVAYPEPAGADYVLSLLLGPVQDVVCV